MTDAMDGYRTLDEFFADLVETLSMHDLSREQMTMLKAGFYGGAAATVKLFHADGMTVDHWRERIVLALVDYSNTLPN